MSKKGAAPKFDFAPPAAGGAFAAMVSVKFVFCVIDLHWDLDLDLDLLSIY